MKKAILGKKLGMTQVFSQDGKVFPVTVILAGPCTVIQKKTVENDGYDALKVSFEPIREKLVNKPDMGQFMKAQAAPARYMKELKLENCADYEVGSVITCEMFEQGDHIDATAFSKGHGFSGVMQRWNQHTGPMAHGSGYHRGVGSMGANSSPSRVFKNKHMPGHWGNEKTTVQNLEIVRVDAERGVLLIKGAVPGPKGAMVFVRQSVKSK